MGGDLLAFAHGVAQDVSGSVDALQLAGGQLDQFGAELLQLVIASFCWVLDGRSLLSVKSFVLHGARSEWQRELL